MNYYAIRCRFGRHRLIVFMPGAGAPGPPCVFYVRRRVALKLKEEYSAKTKRHVMVVGREKSSGDEPSEREPWQLAILTRSIAESDSLPGNLIAGSRGSDSRSRPTVFNCSLSLACLLGRLTFFGKNHRHSTRTPADVYTLYGRKR